MFELVMVYSWVVKGLETMFYFEMGPPFTDWVCADSLSFLVLQRSKLVIHATLQYDKHESWLVEVENPNICNLIYLKKF